MVVAHVEVVQSFSQGSNGGRVAMTEVEHASVAVTVPEPAAAVGVAKAGPLTLADHDVEPRSPEERRPCRG